MYYIPYDKYHLSQNGLVALCVLFFSSHLAFSQASLHPDDIIEELVINYEGIEDSFTVLCDAVNRSQWYYIPNAPRLTEILIGGVPHPEFTLLRYQFVDDGAPGGIKDGGIIQFSTSLSAEPAAINALKEELRAILQARPGGAPANLALAPLPLKSAEALIYSPTDGQLVTNSFGSGLAPIFASQKAPFALYLSRNGADINDALVGNSVNSNTGIPIAIVFTFHGLTPPAKLKITANYRKIFNHYSSDQAFAARASYFGLFGATSEIRWSSIRENLSIDGALKVERITNEEIDEKVMDEVMQGVMKRINDNIFQTMSPPPTIPPANATTPSVKGRFGGAGYNASFKNVEQISDVDDVFEWVERKIVERKTLAGGFIGLGQYPQDVRNRAVQFVPGFDWSTAHFVLPDIGYIDNLTQVTIRTDLLNGDKIVSNQTKTGLWKPSTGWRSVPNNQPINNLNFAIAPLLQNGIPASSLKFRTTTTVIQNGRATELTNTQDLVNGGFPIATPEEGLKTVIFDPSDLNFSSLIESVDLLRVGVTMRIGDRSFQSTIQPRLEEGILKRPNPLVWVVKNEEAEALPIRVNLRYEYKAGSSLQSRDVVIDNLKVANNESLDYLLRDPATLNQ